MEHITPEEVDDIKTITTSDKQAWQQEPHKHIQTSKLGRVMTAVSSEATYNLPKGNDWWFWVCEQIHCTWPRLWISYCQEVWRDHGNNSEAVWIILYIYMDYPHLAAKPDGLVREGTVFEVKCLYATRYRVVTPESVPYLVHDQSGNLCLNSKHGYYAQVQGQMLTTKCHMCPFLVHTLLADITIINVPHNNVFVDQMLDRVKDLWTKCLTEWETCDNFFKPFLLKKLHYKQWEVWERYWERYNLNHKNIVQWQHILSHTQCKSYEHCVGIYVWYHIYLHNIDKIWWPS